MAVLLPAVRPKISAEDGRCKVDVTCCRRVAAGCSGRTGTCRVFSSATGTPGYAPSASAPPEHRKNKKQCRDIVGAKSPHPPLGLEDMTPLKNLETMTLLEKLKSMSSPHHQTMEHAPANLTSHFSGLTWQVGQRVLDRLGGGYIFILQREAGHVSISQGAGVILRKLNRVQAHNFVAKRVILF